MTILKNPAKICQPRFVDANARCNKVRVRRSRAKRNGADIIRCKIGSGACRRMRVTLWTTKAKADAVKRTRAMTLFCENRNVSIQATMVLGPNRTCVGQGTTTIFENVNAIIPPVGDCSETYVGTVMWEMREANERRTLEQCSFYWVASERAQMGWLVVEKLNPSYTAS